MSEGAVPQSGSIDDATFPTTVLLVRHGESMAVVPGSPESKDPALSSRGEEQGAAVAERLATARLTAVYSSHLARAAQTAAAIAEPHGLVPVAREDLREVDLGEWEEGGFRTKAAEHDPAYLEFVADGRWEVIPGAERDDDLRARVVAALDDIAGANAGGRVAVVCHGGVINAVLAHRWDTRRSMLVAVDNTSISVLRTDGVHWLVQGVNDRHHLGEAW
jgi:2,3-bisphosphoglycerate-dependent phosphoglycerate mutase